jgi:LMBR1 domain-containing protein 1
MFKELASTPPSKHGSLGLRSANVIAFPDLSVASSCPALPCFVFHGKKHLLLPFLKASVYTNCSLSSDVGILITMALIQTSLIWVAYAVAVVLLLAIAAIFVYLYQTPRDRAASVTTVCIFTTSALLATVLLTPVDIALTSSTSLSSQGRKKDWATPDRVNSIVKTLEIVYYTLYSLDALLCLIVVPFTYFWYEEYDEDATEHGEQTFGQRFWGAFKYTIAFILFVVIIFLVGFFVPFAKRARDDDRLDLDFFKHLLAENRE